MKMKICITIVSILLALQSALAVQPSPDRPEPEKTECEVLMDYMPSSIEAAESFTMTMQVQQFGFTVFEQKVNMFKDKDGNMLSELLESEVDENLEQMAASSEQDRSISVQPDCSKAVVTHSEDGKALISGKDKETNSPFEISFVENEAGYVPLSLKTKTTQTLLIIPITFDIFIQYSDWVW